MTAADRRRVLAVEQVEELQQDPRLHAAGDVEPLGDANVEIRERRRGEGVTPGVDVDAVHRRVAVRIDQHAAGGRLAEMEAALSAENAADLKLVGQFDHAVDLQHVIDREIGRSLVAIGSVQERPGLLHQRAVGAGELAVGVGAAGGGFGDDRDGADEAV